MLIPLSGGDNMERITAEQVISLPFTCTVSYNTSPLNKNHLISLFRIGNTLLKFIGLGTIINKTRQC